MHGNVIFIEKVDNKRLVLDILVEAGICKSKGEARRLIQQNGISIDEGWKDNYKKMLESIGNTKHIIIGNVDFDEPYKSTDPNWTIDIENEEWVDIKVGKKNHYRVFFI